MKQIVGDDTKSPTLVKRGGAIDEIAEQVFDWAVDRDTDLKRYVDAVNKGDWTTAAKYKPTKYNGNLGESVLDTAATVIDFTRIPDNIKAAIAQNKQNAKIKAENQKSYARDKAKRNQTLYDSALSAYQQVFPEELTKKQLKQYGLSDDDYLEMKAKLWGMSVEEYKANPPTAPQMGYGTKKKSWFESFQKLLTGKQKNSRLLVTSNVELLELGKQMGLSTLSVVSVDQNHSDVCIINSEDSTKGGAHWTARYKNLLYDPFGLPSDNRIIKQAKRVHDKVYTNTFQHQEIDEFSCGFYCLMFLNEAKKHDSDQQQLIDWFYEYCDTDVTPTSNRA